VAENGIFSRCMATNLTQYALAEAQSTLTPNDCAVKQVHDQFLSTDQSFVAMIRAIALSDTLSFARQVHHEVVSLSRRSFMSATGAAVGLHTVCARSRPMHRGGDGAENGCS